MRLDVRPSRKLYQPMLDCSFIALFKAVDIVGSRWMFWLSCHALMWRRICFCRDGAVSWDDIHSSSPSKLEFQVSCAFGWVHWTTCTVVSTALLQSGHWSWLHCSLIFIMRAHPQKRVECFANHRLWPLDFFLRACLDASQLMSCHCSSVVMSFFFSFQYFLSCCSPIIS